MKMPPEQALVLLAGTLREDASVISAHVIGSDEIPVLGLLGAAGPRTADAPGEYALLIETIREGYLLHFGGSRLLAGQDPDLALLAGDYLYALGLERLAALGDLAAVRELSDLISLCAQLHAGDGTPRRAPQALWLAAVTAVACGGGGAHEAAKAALREGRVEAPGMLWAAATQAADEAGTVAALSRAADAVGFGSFPPPDLG